MSSAMTVLPEVADCIEHLCEQEEHLTITENCVLDLLDSIDAVLQDTGLNDDALNSKLDSIQQKRDALLEALIDLRASKFETKEDYVLILDRLEDELIKRKRSHKILGIKESAEILEKFQMESLQYTNMLHRLATEIAVLNRDDNPVIASGPNPRERPSLTTRVNASFLPSTGILQLLNRLHEPQADTNQLRTELTTLLDNVKFSRAQYQLENKYVLHEQVLDLTRQVNRWRKEWDDIETLLFGDGPRSIKSVVKNVENLKQQLSAGE